jgi:hypothetical protein
LLGFAGKDARCYPSLETLGASLGVSDRQARDYVKELERAGLIAIDQRGLRKTNVYLFLWTADLDQMLRSVPGRPTEPDGPDSGPSGSSTSERNTASALDRNRCSGLDRKYSAALGRNTCSGPIGINSVGISSQESSSSSPSKSETPAGAAEELGVGPEDQQRNRTARVIRRWMADRGLRRIRNDRRVGAPEKERLQEWAGLLLDQGVADSGAAARVLMQALTCANRSGPWRSWKFLTLQIQIAAEQLRPSVTPVCLTQSAATFPSEEPASEWTAIKARIRERIPEVAFVNWFEATSQVERCGETIIVAVPDDATAAYINSEYDLVVQSAALAEGILRVRLLRQAGWKTRGHTDTPSGVDQRGGH